MTRQAPGNRNLAPLDTNPSWRSVWRAPVLLAILAVVAGIVAMHALSVGHHAPVPVATHSSHHHTSDVGLEIQHTAGTPVAASMAPSTFFACGLDCTGDHGTAGAMCVAALTVLLLLGRPRRRPLTRTRSALNRAPNLRIFLPAPQRPPRAPSLAGLCILRI